MFAWGPRDSWDSRLSAEGETVPPAKLGFQVGSTDDHKGPYPCSTGAARRGFEMSPGEPAKMKVLTGRLWWAPDAVFPIRCWGSSAAGLWTPL